MSDSNNIKQIQQISDEYAAVRINSHELALRVDADETEINQMAM